MDRAEGAGGVERRLRGHADGLESEGHTTISGPMREAADAVAVLEEVDAWFRRRGQRTDDGYFFYGLPAPEVGELAARVRAAIEGAGRKERR